MMKALKAFFVILAILFVAMQFFSYVSAAEYRTEFTHCDIGGPWGWRASTFCPDDTQIASGMCPQGSTRYDSVNTNGQPSSGCYYTGSNQGGSYNACWDYPHDQSDECCFFVCQPKLPPFIESLSVSPDTVEEGNAITATGTAKAGAACITSHRFYVLGSQGGEWSDVGCKQSVSLNDQISTSQNDRSFYQNPSSYTMRWEIVDADGKTTSRDVQVRINAITPPTTNPQPGSVNEGCDVAGPRTCGTFSFIGDNTVQLVCMDTNGDGIGACRIPTGELCPTETPNACFNNAICRDTNGDLLGRCIVPVVQTPPTINSYSISSSQVNEGTSVTVTGSAVATTSCLARHRVYVVGSQGGGWTTLGCQQSVSLNDLIPTERNPLSFYNVPPATYTLRWEVEDSTGMMTFQDLSLTINPAIVTTPQPGSVNDGCDVSGPRTCGNFSFIGGNTVQLTCMDTNGDGIGACRIPTGNLCPTQTPNACYNNAQCVDTNGDLLGKCVIPAYPNITSFTVSHSQVVEGTPITVIGTANSGSSCIKRHRFFVAGSQGGQWMDVNCLDTVNLGSVVPTFRNPSSFYNNPPSYYTLRWEVEDSEGKVSAVDRLLFISAVGLNTTNSSDITPPGQITNLNAIPAQTSALISWTNPADPDFSHTLIYFNGQNVANVTGTIANLTGLVPNSTYTFFFTTSDVRNNLNPSLASLTFTTLSTSVAPNSTDTTPPSPVSGLAASSVTANSIVWTWTNPADPDFQSAIVYLNGVNVINTSSTSYTASGLAASTQYNITLYTRDINNNINTNGVSLLTTTSAGSTPGGNGGNGGSGGSGGSSGGTRAGTTSFEQESIDQVPIILSSDDELIYLSSDDKKKSAFSSIFKNSKVLPIALLAICILVVLAITVLVRRRIRDE